MEARVRAACVWGGGGVGMGEDGVGWGKKQASQPGGQAGVKAQEAHAPRRPQSNHPPICPSINPSIHPPSPHQPQSIHPYTPA